METTKSDGGNKGLKGLVLQSLSAFAVTEELKRLEAAALTE